MVKGRFACGLFSRLLPGRYSAAPVDQEPPTERKSWPLALCKQYADAGKLLFRR
jgi:hypothetical protein